ncbi:MAG: hypothetical protein AB1505_20435 [Candidatus Latescibacterota bacterium]
MGSRAFDQVWRRQVRRVRASRFWQQVCAPPRAPIERGGARPRRGEVEVTAEWVLASTGDLRDGGPARRGLEDLREFLGARLGIQARTCGSGPRLLFELAPRPGADRWEAAFQLDVGPQEVRVRAATEAALLRASLYLSNYWSLRRLPCLPRGVRRIRPSVELHLGADLWGGFSTTQAWVYGRERDDNFLELARMGVNGVPVMALLEDYIDADPTGLFGRLVNPQARAHRQRLARLARRAADCGVHVFLMGYNPKLALDHPLFAAVPQCRGASQSNDAFRALCTSDPTTRRFLVEAWASLFAEIPELGGIEAITGGEGFYHCFMRSPSHASDCPRCGQRPGSEVVAELVNAVAAGIRARNPEARLVTWPYSAGHWSGDRDQVAFIDGLDPEHVVFQTEVDKDSVDWRPAGYAKNVWDYSVSMVGISPRCRRQRQQCRRRGLPFSVKLQVGNSIECLSVPYIPALENQRRIWENARRLRPRAIHSRWLFDGSCKGPSEELGFWALWGKGTPFENLDATLTALAERDFGRRAVPLVRRAWRCFSAGMRHHPQLDYYRGSYFVGVGQPLVLDPDRATIQAGLDPAFFGLFYWLWEDSVSDDEAAFEQKRPLFYARPGFRALARRGPQRGQDVALPELQAMAALWEQGAAALESARPHVPAACRPRFEQEYILGWHLALTWRSAANVEEFLRLRDTVREFSGQSWVRSGHHRENLRDLDSMEELARAEVELARRDLELVERGDFLDLGLRLDMGTASSPQILRAKIRQVEHLLREELPAWRLQLSTW